jgi:hypothetical protein
MGFSIPRIKLEKICSVSSLQSPPLLNEIPDLKYQLAWVEGRWEPIQLAEAARQRGVEEFHRFWFWLYGLEKPPTWFEEKLHALVTDPRVLDATTHPRLSEHLEQYSKAILEGNRVVVVSHSSGGFYANAALRALEAYVPKALHPPIEERRRQSALYPDLKQLISAVYVAPIVEKTWEGTPWVSFKDDQMLGWIGKVLGIPSGNISAGATRITDMRAHSLAAYLHAEEGRRRIAAHIRDEAMKLRYPIPYLANAASVEYASIVKGKYRPDFRASFVAKDSHEITEVNERRESGGTQWRQYFAPCMKLRPGPTEIRAESVGSSGKMDFEARVAGSDAPSGGARLRMRNRKEIERWRLGQITVSEGKGAQPMEVEVRMLGEPERRP